ncbi:MAG: hypothetical protein JWN73_3238 [Betaproteobacteria bacterium]|nr:hypothetical protein [Betaproteobacteria bacterium]
MVTNSLRFLPAAGLILAACFAADAWHKRAKARNAKADLSQEIKTWEGEGGNLPAGAASASASPSSETSLAASAP